jgi:hypothetical protein
MLFEPMGRLLEAGAHLRFAAIAADDAARKRPRDPATRLAFARALEALGNAKADARALTEYREALRLSDARAAAGGGLSPTVRESIEAAVRRLADRPAPANNPQDAGP